MRAFDAAAIAAFAAVVPVASAAPARSALSDAQIKQRLVKQSIAEYPGNCPCPYNTARNGSRCGRRSAYNRGGGYAPYCFAGDVGAAEVRAYRQSH